MESTRRTDDEPDYAETAGAAAEQAGSDDAAMDPAERGATPEVPLGTHVGAAGMGGGVPTSPGGKPDTQADVRGGEDQGPA
jgi:hypothetical protein